MKLYVIKDELDHFEDNFSKIIQIFWQKGQIRICDSYSESYRIRIHNTGYWQEYYIRL